MGDTVVDPFVDGGPALVLMPSARVSLAPDTQATAQGLRDTVTGSIYPMNGVGQYVVGELATPITLDELSYRVSVRFGVDQLVARRDLTIFLSFLDHHRLSSIRQSFPREAALRLGALFRNVALVATLRPALSRGHYPTRRYRATLGAIGLRCLEAHQPTLLLGYLLAGVAIGIYAVRDVHLGARPISMLSITTALILLAYFAGIVMSVAVHESAHFVTARALGIRVRCVFVRMFVTGISQEGGTDLSRALVSISGPAAAALLLLTLAIALFLSGVGETSIRVGLCFALLLTAAQHVPSLLPWSADGKQVRSAVRRRMLARGSAGG